MDDFDSRSLKLIYVARTLKDQLSLIATRHRRSRGCGFLHTQNFVNKMFIFNHIIQDHKELKKYHQDHFPLISRSHSMEKTLENTLRYLEATISLLKKTYENELKMIMGTPQRKKVEKDIENMKGRDYTIEKWLSTWKTSSQIFCQLENERRSRKEKRDVEFNLMRLISANHDLDLPREGRMEELDPSYIDEEEEERLLKFFSEEQGERELSFLPPPPSPLSLIDHNRPYRDEDIEQPPTTSYLHLSFFGSDSHSNSERGGEEEEERYKTIKMRQVILLNVIRDLINFIILTPPVITLEIRNYVDGKLNFISEEVSLLNRFIEVVRMGTTTSSWEDFQTLVALSQEINYIFMSLLYHHSGFERTRTTMTENILSWERRPALLPPLELILFR